MSFWEDTYHHSASQGWGWACHRDILGSLLGRQGLAPWSPPFRLDWAWREGAGFVRQRPGLRFASGLDFLRETRSPDQIKLLDFPILATISKRFKKIWHQPNACWPALSYRPGLHPLVSVRNCWLLLSSTAIPSFGCR